MASGTTLTSWEPSLRDRIAWWVGDLFGDNKTMRNYGMRKAREVADFVPLVGGAVGVDEAKRDFDAGNYGSAAINGALSVLGEIPGGGDLAVAGAKALPAMIMGPMSRTWNKEMHHKAMDMADDGQTVGRIWDETQSYFNPMDRHWRQLLPGSDKGKVKIGDLVDSTTDALDSGQPSMFPHMGNVWKYPELTEAYPQIMDMPVITMPPGQFSSLGGFVPGDNPAIVLGMDRIMDSWSNPAARGVIPEDFQRKDLVANGEPLARSVLGHESQHAIQQIEGWDPGFSPDAAYEQLLRPGSYPDAWLEKNFPKTGIEPDVDDFVRPMTFDAYRRNSGEVEARLAQMIMQNDPALVRQLGPYSPVLMDFPWSHQLTYDDLTRGIFGPDGVPGLSLSGPVKRLR